MMYQQVYPRFIKLHGQNDSSMAFNNDAQVFFYRYRKLLMVLAVLALFYPPLEIYKAINHLSDGHTGEAVGSIADAVILLCVSVYMIAQVRRAIKLQKQEVSENTPQ